MFVAILIDLDVRHTAVQVSGLAYVGREAPPGWPVTEQPSPADNVAAGRELLARTDSLYADVLRWLRARLELAATTAGRAWSPPDGWPVCRLQHAVVPRAADWPATRT
jgi:hypothetical protein